jgi:hypothetical protein
MQRIDVPNGDCVVAGVRGDDEKVSKDSSMRLVVERGTRLLDGIAKGRISAEMRITSVDDMRVPGTGASSCADSDMVCERG